MNYKKLLLPLLILPAISLTGQVSYRNSVPDPRPPAPSILPPGHSGFNSPPSSSTSNAHFNRAKQQQQYHQSQQEAERRREEELNRILQEDALEIEERERYLRRVNSRSVNYSLPSQLHRVGAGSFPIALHSLKGMASDMEHFSITKAVFTVENAFYNNTGDFERFNANLQQVADFLIELMPEYGYSMEDNLAKNLMIFRFFTDTLVSQDGNFFHTPIRYDFEDPRGKKDYAKMLVAKLLVENSGQCHSLPLLYLMLAEKMDTEVYLVKAPNHTYLKFPLPNGGFQNVELTSHVLTTDDHVMMSGFITAEALQNELYMQALSSKELLAYCVTDLIREYVWKYEHDPFVQRMLDFAFDLDPKSIDAQLLQANQNTFSYMYVEQQLGITPENAEEKLKGDPKAYALYEKRNALYDQLDLSGYRYMNPQEYENWLTSIMEEGKKWQERQQQIKQLERSIKKD